MGVCAIGGQIQGYWYPGFVESHSIEQLCAAVQHEIEHVLRLHCTRNTKHCTSVALIAADMCVNGTKASPRIGYKDAQRLILPMTEDEGLMVWVPDGWPDKETYEYYYERLVQSIPPCPKCGGYRADDPHDGSQPCSCPGGGLGRPFDDHSLWRKSDMNPEEVRQLVKEIARQAASRSQGLLPDHIPEILVRLADPIISWRQILRQYLGHHLGNRRVTYARRNRRRDEFGLPGISHHAAAECSVVIDTSGSIGPSDLEQFFAEIESVAYRTKVCVLQWDAAFQGFWPRYRRNDWKKIKIKGRGGTDMASPVEWLEKNRLIGQVCIMLTDGYANYTSKKPFPMITCITTHDGSKPDWGTVIRMNKQNARNGLHA